MAVRSIFLQNENQQVIQRVVKKIAY